MSTGDPTCPRCGGYMAEHNRPCDGPTDPATYGDWGDKSPYTELYETCEKLMRERDEALQLARRMKTERDRARRRVRRMMDECNKTIIVYGMELARWQRVVKDIKEIISKIL